MKPRNVVLVCVLAGIVSATACRTVRPKRFSNLTITPAPVSSLRTPIAELAPASAEAALLTGLVTRYGSSASYLKPWYRKGSFATAALLSAASPPGPLWLGASLFAETAPPSTTVRSSSYMRSLERAQAQMARVYLEQRKLDSASGRPIDVAEAFSGLLTAIDDRKEENPSDMVRPRVSLTLSHTLALPGEWERVQYLAVYLALHSPDVTFADTNEFESIFRDIDLGTLTEKASNKISGSAKATAGVGFGSETGGGKTTKGAETGVSAEASYEETLVRALKEQLQFRSSSIDGSGRTFGIVLKSSQQNKLPTLLRQIVTLKYARSAQGRLTVPIVDKGGLAGIRLADQPLRGAGLAARDASSDSGQYFASATPFVVGVVRRVLNAKGVNTSVEDDDSVVYVTQALRLPAITLDRISKCAYMLDVSPTEVVTVQLPSWSSPRQVFVNDRSQAELLQRSVSDALARATALQRTSGELFGSSTAAGLTKSLWGFQSLAALPGPNRTDWTLIGNVTLRPICDP